MGSEGHEDMWWKCPACGRPMDPGYVYGPRLIKFRKDNKRITLDETTTITNLFADNLRAEERPAWNCSECHFLLIRYEGKFSY